MFSKIYFKFRERKVHPIVVVLIILLGGTLCLVSTPFAIILVSCLSLFCSYKYGDMYWGQFKRLVIVGILVGLATLDVKRVIPSAIRVMAFSHQIFLVFYLCPPSSFKHPYVRLTLTFMPYFEKQIQNVIYTARVKGLKLKTKNPFRFLADGRRLFIPMLFILLRSIPNVEDGLKLKGYDYQ